MKCEQCHHRLVCMKEHMVVDAINDKFYFDLDNVEVLCNNFSYDMNLVEFPCHVGQKLYHVHKGYINNVETLIVEEVFVITIRYRTSIATDVISETNVESNVQIFVGPADSNKLTEVNGRDFNKTLFYTKEAAEAVIKK